ncbi:hypothetical protein EV641_109203 [Rhodococcus sp. SMB37]|uniref:hypothetical protein n=1 Tax=Rhodococcus sp. SMB37 TaxID=2512213 RepID=UPI001050A14D|nr:hypothetical protein [Rhodococcus sp. SMB37]TCN51812.1 hypothetical protein EV641_109203 [Rhodococcus sp. SMB37]
MSQELTLFDTNDHRDRSTPRRIPSPRRDTHTTNWQPDDHLITAAQAGQLHIRNLTAEDRSWVVAGLTARGVTAEDTATMLRCSLRLIKQIRAHPMTAVSHYAQTIAVEVETTVSKEKTKNRAHAYELENLRMTAERYKQQRDKLIDQLAKQARKAERQNA